MAEPTPDTAVYHQVQDGPEDAQGRRSLAAIDTAVIRMMGPDFTVQALCDALDAATAERDEARAALDRVRIVVAEVKILDAIVWALDTPPDADDLPDPTRPTNGAGRTTRGYRRQDIDE